MTPRTSQNIKVKLRNVLKIFRGFCKYGTKKHENPFQNEILEVGI